MRQNQLLLVSTANQSELRPPRSPSPSPHDEDPESLAESLDVDPPRCPPSPLSPSTGRDSRDLEDSEPPSKRARVETVEDREEAGGLPRRPWVDYSGRDYPDENPWAPYADEEEWQLARWALLHHVTKSAWDDYLKLPFTA